MTLKFLRVGLTFEQSVSNLFDIMNNKIQSIKIIMYYKNLLLINLKYFILYNSLPICFQVTCFYNFE